MVHPTNTDGDSFGGTLDVRSFDFAGNVLSIDAHEPWESYPEKLYAPAGFESGGAAGAGVFLPTPEYSRIRYATHRLTLLLIPSETYGVSMKSADYAMRILIGGKEIDDVASWRRRGKISRRERTTAPITSRRQVNGLRLSSRPRTSSTALYVGNQRNIERKTQTDMFLTL